MLLYLLTSTVSTTLMSLAERREICRRSRSAEITRPLESFISPLADPEIGSTICDVSVAISYRQMWLGLVACPDDGHISEKYTPPLPSYNGPSVNLKPVSSSCAVAPGGRI